MRLEKVDLKKLQERSVKFFVLLDDSEVSDLRESIERRGVLVPLLVTKDFEIIDGWNRFIAADSADLKEVPCQIIEEDLNEDEKNFLMFETNLRRRQLTEDERFKAQEQLYDLTKKILDEEHAKIIAKSKRKITKQPTLLPESGEKTALKPIQVIEEVLPEPRAKLGKNVGGRPPKNETSDREISRKSHISKGTIHKIKEYKKAKEEEPDLEGLAASTVIKKAKERKMTDEEVKTEKFCIALRNDVQNYLKQIPEPNLLQEVKVLLSHFLTSESLRNSIFKLIHEEKQDSPIAKNISEEIIMTYKRIAGFDVKDRIWNKVYFPRYVKDAKILMQVADDDITKAKKAIEIMGSYYENENLSWTLKTIFNNFHKFDIHPEQFKIKIPYALKRKVADLEKQTNEDLKELDERIEKFSKATKKEPKNEK